MPTSRNPKRDGFTLVELLVVITILGILLALTAAAVYKVIGRGDELKLRNEISQFGNAIQTFKTTHGVSYIPSKLTLPPGADNTGQSAVYLAKVWPRINSTYLGNGPPAYAYWGLQNNKPAVLSGDQTLVFFLGGTRDSNGNPIGFSSNPTNPLDISGTSRQGPFFEFTASRLKVLKGSSGNPFPSYMDIYGDKPYLYFSSKNGNDYDPTESSMQFNVQPYRTSPTRFANATSFQIISAGKDGVFGPGALSWGGGSSGANADGYDDMSNFWPTLLGIAQ